jgi:general stress protein YciG
MLREQTVKSEKDIALLGSSKETSLKELDEFVANCHLEYSLKGMEPGNPFDGDWEKCHHPIPRCEGGSDTVWLLRCHHAVHNVLQSEWLQRVCIFGWEREYLSDSLIPLYKKWMAEKGGLVGSSNKGKSSASWDKRKHKWREICSAGGKASVKAKRDRGEPLVRYEKLKPDHYQKIGRLGGLKRAKGLNNKEWKDPFDGFIGSAGTVAARMKQLGRDPKLKVRIEGLK